MVEVKHNLRLHDRSFDRFKRSAARAFRFATTKSRVRRLSSFPRWYVISIGANVLMFALFIVFGWKTSRMLKQSSVTTLPNPTLSTNFVSTSPPAFSSQLGPHHQLTYESWVDILAQEAQAVVDNPPQQLSILMGDSISLWFPHELLPNSTNWLNQGISGEISNGLLRRLNLIEDTQPDYIFIMIGINDLLRDIGDEVIRDNQREIMRELQAMHPDTTIVLQSILPHGGTLATWENKDLLMEIPNDRIHKLNDDLEAIAYEEGIKFLDLVPLFSDNNGNLVMELSSDGLHLNQNGYLVWASALQLYQQLND